MSFPKGKATVDVNNPQAWGICDRTGFQHNRRDLVKQMEWYGNELLWTGLWVGKTYLDIPNEQNRPLIFPPDPLPIKDPRPQQPTVQYWNTPNGFKWNQQTGIPWNEWASTQDGIPALPEYLRLAQLENYVWGM